MATSNDDFFAALDAPKRTDRGVAVVDGMPFTADVADAAEGQQAAPPSEAETGFFDALDNPKPKPFGPGNPPPGAMAVQVPQPTLLTRLGDLLASTHEIPVVSGVERGLAAGGLDLAGGIENLVGGVPSAVGGAVGHPELGDRFFQTGDYLRDLANQVAATGPQDGAASAAQNITRGLAHYALGPELAAGAAATNAAAEGAQSGAPLGQQFKNAALEGALAEAGGRIPIAGKTLPAKLAAGAGLGLAFPFAEHAGQHYLVGNENVAPLPSLGELAASEAMMLALPALHAGGSKLVDMARGNAPASVRPSAGASPTNDASTVEAALRASGLFTDAQIQALKSDGSLGDIAAAAPRVPGQPAAVAVPATPPRQLPAPTIAVDRAGNAITNAQAMQRARAADAAAQERASLGLTPDVERARQARIDSLLARERAGVGPEPPVPEIPPGRFPEPGEPAAEAVPPEPRRQWQPVRAQNGQIMRDAKGRPLREPVLDFSRDHLLHWLAANGGINFKSLRESADVDPALLKDPDVMRPFGRLGDPALRRNGGMTVDQAVERMQEAGWLPQNDPNAPPEVGNDDATSMILDALNGHEITHPVEGVDERLQRRAAEHYADEARHEAEMAEDRAAQTEAERTHDLRALREHNAQFADADAGEALTVHQWIQRARDAGVPDESIRDALSREDWTPTLNRLIQERGNGTDTGATAVDLGRGNAPAGEGQIAEPGPAPHGPERGAAVEASEGRRGDLFPDATGAERIRAAREAKDAERNGLNRQAPTPAFAGTDLGATPRGEAPEQLDLTTPKAQSTHYGETRNLQRGGAAEPAAGDVRSARAVPGQLDLFVATRGDRPAAAIQAAAPRLLQRAKVVTTGVFKSGIQKIRDWKDAAHIIAPLRKYPQEQFLAVVADAEGRPLAVLRHTIGVRDASSVDVGNVFGSIAQIPGAKQVWFAHNHPSGHMEQSAQDRSITGRLHDLMRGSGIETHGMIQIGPGHATATHFNPDFPSGIETRGNTQHPITPAARTGEVPIVERALRKVASGERPQLRSPSDLPRLVKEVAHGETGAILLDNQHRVVGFLPMSDAEMAHLRTGDTATGAAHVAAVSNEATAAAVVMVARDAKAARNLGTFFADAGIHPLDIAVIGEHGQVSSQSWGTSTRTDGLPFASEEPRPARGQEAQDNVNEIAESDLSPADRELVQRTRERAAQARDNSDLNEAMRRESAERGEREANEFGLRDAIERELGPERTQRIHYVYDVDGIPSRARASSYTIKKGNVLYGLKTPDGDIYILAKSANTPAKAVWTAWHEHGHLWMQTMAENHPDVKVGTKTARQALGDARKMFLQNSLLHRLAKVIATQRGSTDLPRMAEEAMVEARAALETGDWQAIVDKYGAPAIKRFGPGMGDPNLKTVADIPRATREGVRGAIANFVRRLTRIINAIHAKLTGKPNAFTDADVHDFLRSMREAQGEHGAHGEQADSYERVPDTLMGFRKSGPNKPFSEQRYRHEQPVRVTFDNGDSIVDVVKGMNKEHALERARRNWDGARIDPITEAEYRHGIAEEDAMHAKLTGMNSEERGTNRRVATDKNVAGNQGPRAAGDESRRDASVAAHRPASPDYGSRADDLSKAFPDIYSPDAVSTYGDGVDGSEDRAAVSVIRKMRGDPDASITIYRAVPRDAPTGIRAGDWVTTTRQYAERHGESVLDGDYKVVSQSVPVRTLYNEGNSIHEFGYHPKGSESDSSAPGSSGASRTGEDLASEEPAQTDILHSEEPQDRADAFGRGAGGHAIPESEGELPPRAPGESQKAYHARVIRESRATMVDGLKASVGLRTLTQEEKRQQTIGRGGLRAMWAKNQRAADKAAAAFHQAQRVFDKAGKNANLEAIHQWETGADIASASHRLFFKAMQAEFQKRIDAIRAISPGTLEHVIENYFPHLWEDPIKAGKWYQREFGKRPLEGNKSFLKQRVHATMKDGMAAGLKPVSTNPVDLVLAKMAQMDKFLALHEFRKDLQDRGWLKEMEPGERVPYGYARVDDPAFVKAAGLQGYFAVPEPIARDLNNYLSPSLYRFAPFKAFRRLQNLVMMARLGWSAFHAGFTTLDNLVMHADVGVRYALNGDIKRALITWAKTPLSVVWSPIEGGKLNRQWLGLDKADANTAALLDALEQGGAHYKMDTSEYNQGLRRFIRAFQQKDYGKSARAALSAAGEAGSWIIHHKLVPNQKMAARLLLAKSALDRVAGKLGKDRGDYAGIIEAMRPDALRQIMGDVVKNVDDRLGQMNYDNQFWNKTAREVAQAIIGAVGWQVGTVRTVTGGVRDLQRLWSPEKLVSALDKDGKITDADMGRVTGRLTYLVSLALIMGGGNAALQYMMTGKGPSELKDYFFPKTGNKNADGSDERLQLPTYWMDHYKLATHPLQTAEHKIHPVFSMIMEAIANQDYWGVEIHDPHASWAKQAEQIGEYVAKGFLPYSVTNNQKARANEAGAGRQAASFFGVTTAPASVSRSKFQSFVAHNGNKGFGHEKRTAVDAEHSRTIKDIENQIRNGGEPDLSGLNRKDLLRVRRESREQVPEIQFKKMDIEDKLDAWDMATPKERKEYHLRRDILTSHGTQTVRFRRLPADERHAVLERIMQVRDARSE